MQLRVQFLRATSAALLAGVSLLGVTSVCLGEEAKTRNDLIFAIHTALKTRDYPALARCFEFERAEGPTQQALWKALEQMIAWPTHSVKVTERKGSGPFYMTRDGRSYTMNGDWQYQVHIHAGPPPSRGYVFPAGVTQQGRHAILLTVPEAP